MEVKAGALVVLPAESHVSVTACRIPQCVARLAAAYTLGKLQVSLFPGSLFFSGGRFSHSFELLIKSDRSQGDANVHAGAGELAHDLRPGDHIQSVGIEFQLDRGFQFHGQFVFQ